MGGFRRYAQAVRPLLPPVMQASEHRVFGAVFEATPDAEGSRSTHATGHMQRSLRKTSEFVPVEREYAVFWDAQDFPPGEFYPAEALLHLDPMSPAIEAERPILRNELARALQQAARTVAR